MAPFSPCFLRGFHGRLCRAHGLQFLLSGFVPRPQLLYGRKVRARRSKLAQVAMQAAPALQAAKNGRLARGTSPGGRLAGSTVTMLRLATVGLVQSRVTRCNTPSKEIVAA